MGNLAKLIEFPSKGYVHMRVSVSHHFLSLNSPGCQEAPARVARGIPLRAPRCRVDGQLSVPQRIDTSLRVSKRSVRASLERVEYSQSIYFVFEKAPLYAARFGAGESALQPDMLTKTLKVFYLYYINSVDLDAHRSIQNGFNKHYIFAKVLFQ